MDWQGTACQTCGRPSQDPEQLNPVSRVCKIILDRTGFGPRVTVEDETPPDVPRISAARR